MTTERFVVLFGIYFALACGGGGETSKKGIYVPSSKSPSYLEDTETEQSKITSFKPIPEGKWNGTAIRKILHIFALGSSVSDSQIDTWSEMTPDTAIQEIISLNAINLKNDATRKLKIQKWRTT